MKTTGKVIERRLTQMIAESRLIAGLMLIKIPTLKQRICHAFPLIGGQSTLCKEFRKISLRKQHFFLCCLFLRYDRVDHTLKS